MQISTSYLDINSYQSLEHTSGCLCASCCKSTSAGDSVEVTEDKEDKSINKDITKLTSSERQELSLLQQRDQEVRTHEAAHIAAGGSVISGGASFVYQEGPDGKLYAIGGEVPINISSGSTPQEEIVIAKQVQAAALAPANPSPQDLKVAATAVMMEAKARQELSDLKREEIRSESGAQSYENNQGNLDSDQKINYLV